MKEIPCVQYGFPDDKGPTRAPTLRTIYDPIPEDAETVSPIYALTCDQYERQHRRDNPYAVKGYTSIATELQDDCESNDKVLYPIHIESDELRNLGSSRLIKWFRKFVENYLDVAFSTCKLYFSGNRSIHVHVPRFVSGEDQRKQLKELAEEFCIEKGAELDCGLYSAKRVFRLPGVEHAKTGIPKLEMDGEWDAGQLVQKVTDGTSKTYNTYADVLKHVFISQESLTVSASQPSIDGSFDLFRILDSDETVLELGPDQQKIDTPLIEQTQYPDDSVEAIRWLQYNAKEFSPYALAEGHSRSVAALRVKGGAFSRKSKRDGSTMVPAQFYGAVGANGEYTKEQEHAPLQLSEQDFKKCNFQTNDTVVIIGGRSRNSKILEVNNWQAHVVGHALTGENQSRDDALKYLESEGYDIGSAGSTNASSTNTVSSTPKTTEIWPARENAHSEAEALQRQAEQGSIQRLTHQERIQVACRTLRYGWKPAWDWFAEQFGEEFKPQVTWKFFSGIVEDDRYEAYDHIEVPGKPI